MQSRVLALVVLCRLTSPLVAAPTPPESSNSQILSKLGAELSSTNHYGAPIPPWIPGSKPGWYFGQKYDSVYPGVPYLDSEVCEWLNQLPDALHCPNTYPPPHLEQSYTHISTTTHKNTHSQYSYYTPTYETNPATIETKTKMTDSGSATSPHCTNSHTTTTKHPVTTTTKHSYTVSTVKYQHSAPSTTRGPSTTHSTGASSMTSTTKHPSPYTSSHGYGYGSPQSSHSSSASYTHPLHTSSNDYTPSHTTSSTIQGYGSSVTTSAVYGSPSTNPVGYGSPVSHTSFTSTYGPPSYNPTTSTYAYTAPIYGPPTPSNSYTQTIFNITAAVQADDYITFGMVNTIDDCLKMCDVSEECGFVNTYHDVHGKDYKDGSLLLSCSLFTFCHGPEDADNAGGQTQPDGSINYILDSDGWCKSS